MRKQLLYWFPVMDKNVRGENYANGYADIIARRYRGELIDEILSMPEGNPISFEKAVVLAYDMHFNAVDAHQIGYEPGECHWYQCHFVEWISSLGLQIVLTGDEFEPWIAPDQAS